MEKLTSKDYDLLIELAKYEKEKIHKAAIHDKELRSRELNLDFILIKLKAQKGLKENEK